MYVSIAATAVLSVVMFEKSFLVVGEIDKSFAMSMVSEEIAEYLNTEYILPVFLIVNLKDAVPFTDVMKSVI